MPSTGNKSPLKNGERHAKLETG